MSTSFATGLGWRVLAGLLFALSWAAALVALLALNSLELHACGDDPLTGYEHASCGPVSELSSGCLLAALTALPMWPVRAALPRTWRAARQGVYVAYFVLPVGIVIAVVTAFQLWWPLRSS